MPAAEPKAATTCPPPDDGSRPSATCTLCAARGTKVLLQVIAADAITIPMGASVIAQSPTAKAPRDLEYTIVVTKDRLVAQVFNCPGCRRRMGWGFDVALEDVRALDDDNRRALQKSLGVAEAPLLGTMDDWAAAKVTGKPSTIPSLPGCLTHVGAVGTSVGPAVEFAHGPQTFTPGTLGSYTQP
jgi:hypothetical protein